MQFFEPPRPREPPSERIRARPATPPWIGRPRGVLLGGVAQDVLLVRTSAIAVALSHIAACSDGFAATLIVLAATDTEEPDQAPFGWGPWARHMDPERVLRFGVRYADGGKAELEDRSGPPREGRPHGPVIRRGGGGGGGSEWRQEMWFWPLPPPGPVTLALEWRARGIEQTLHELDAAPLRDAAQRAQTLFPAEEMPDTPGYSIGASHLMEREDR